MAVSVDLDTCGSHDKSSVIAPGCLAAPSRRMRQSREDRMQVGRSVSRDVAKGFGSSDAL